MLCDPGENLRAHPVSEPTAGNHVIGEVNRMKKKLLVFGAMMILLLFV
jgi:hypothetical protein